MKKKKIIYKINKIIRISLYISIIIFSTITIGFIILANSLDYTIPEIETIILYDKDNNQYLSYSNGKKKSYVALDNINDYLIDAFISIEDKRYFTHTGLDFIRICKAAIVDIIYGEAKQGASTITQQYARNLFLTMDKTWKRKLSEMMIALNLESKYSKEEILEGYLNSIYFDHGIYGVEDAALYYFGKNSKDLTLLEAVSLAAIPKGPTIYSPIKNPENNKQRRELILQEMKEDGSITTSEYTNALTEELTFIGINKNKEETQAPYFQDYVLSELKNISGLKEYAHKGLKVETTLDLNLNNQITSFITNRIDNDLETSIIVINPSTGEILSIIGGTSYKENSYNKAVYAKRQPASTVKPFLYLTALENGFTSSTTFTSEKTTFYIGKDTYTPKNYNDSYPNSEISLAYALSTSDNIYAVKTHLFLGMEKLKNTLESFGLSNVPEIPSLALGTYEVTNLEWSSCYQILANEGKKIEPFVIKRITSMEGEVLYENNTSVITCAEKSDVYILNELMTNIFDTNIIYNTRPTGIQISSRLTNTFAAKSGSTDTDNWMIGYNKDLLVSIWTGYDDNRLITSRSDKLTAKYLFADIVEEYFKNKNTTWYQTPDDVISVKLNPITGFYGSFSEYTKELYFRRSNIPWYLRLLPNITEDNH
ncbi:MAG: penicillin-binding protein [Erysipelotrichaceae bacterium]|nr:penicillin-binding protein [Erysipelotrichaceae bacterium]